MSASAHRTSAEIAARMQTAVRWTPRAQHRGGFRRYRTNPDLTWARRPGSRTCRRWH